jgi:transcriptional regulator with XRE-family HTH domain
MEQATTDPEATRLGATIRALREAHGLKIAELAYAIGISRPQLSNIELGARRATPQVCRAIADKLNIPLAAITVEGYEQIAKAAS